MTLPEKITAWGHFGPESVTGEWSANTYDQTAPVAHYTRDDAAPQPMTNKPLADATEVATLRAALTKLRDLMCEGIEDDDGNSGCGQCENDCTGCIAHFALAKIGEAK